MTTYRISYSNPQSQFIQIEAEFEVKSNKEQIIQLPRWRPGRYEIQNFAKRIRAFKAFNTQGSPLQFTKTNLSEWQVGDKVNLERAMQLGARLDGHIVQGHVDQIGLCTSVKEEGGSWVFSFEYDPSQKNITIEKGSITVNGTSLTVVNSGTNTFSVAIIPYTYEHTNFHTFKKGTLVNLEFDVVGKYIIKMQQLQ